MKYDDPPIIEKGEHRYIQDVDHHSPEKSEHGLGFVQMPFVSDHEPIETPHIPKVQEHPHLSTDPPMQHESAKPISEPTFDDFDFTDD